MFNDSVRQIGVHYVCYEIVTLIDPMPQQQG